MRIIHDHNVCSLYHLEGLGEPVAGSYSYNTTYTEAPPEADNIEDFKKKIVAAIEKYEKTNIHDQPGPRCGSFIQTVTIDKQPIASKFLEELGFEGTGFIRFGKYPHQVQHWRMEMRKFLEVIGMPYIWRGGHQDPDDEYF